MKSISAKLCCACLFLCIHANIYSKNISILFIGNSYTYVNNLPEMVRQMGLTMGDTIFVDSSTPGGYTYQLHTTDANTIAKIKQQQWDYVVLQEQSQLPSLSPAFVNVNSVPYALMLDSMIKANNACTKTIFYMTWGRKYGDGSNCASYPPVCTYAGMQQRLKESYLLFSDTCKAVAAPVGIAFKNYIAIDTLLDLYSPDFSHPSLAGSFLAAATIYSTITHNQITNQNYTAGLTVTQAAALQNTSWQTIIDSSALWNLGANTPFANFTYNTLPNLTVQFICPGNVNYTHFWDFGDTTFSTLAEPVHQYLYSSYFGVKHIVYDSCTYDSAQVITNITPQGNSNITLDESNFAFYNSADETIAMSLWKLSSQNVTISLYDVSGKLILKNNYTPTKPLTYLNVRKISNGMYILNAVDDVTGKCFSQKIIKN